MQFSEEDNMKPTFILCLVFFLMLSSGCSTIVSSRFLSLNKGDEKYYKVTREYWMVKGRDPSFGKYSPSLYGFRFENGGELIIYPIIIDSRSFSGPAFLPVIPYPKELSIPEDRNILEFSYSGDPEDFQIKMIDGQNIAPHANKSTGMTTYLHRLEDAFVDDGKLVVELSCGDERKTLEYKIERFTNFVPFFLPL